MPSCQTKYHNVYLQQLSEFDPHVIEWIQSKENIIAVAPYSTATLY